MGKNEYISINIDSFDQLSRKNKECRKKYKYVTLGMKMGHNHRWNRDLKAVKIIMKFMPANLRT